ncbi:MAG TPA: TAXI family TRAP transporter solute-binding subunit [Pseudonocardiaceae bacterium]|nr:TAXI family TRAP transporter solute-binding subunit [Pseudonocardiaceae bacterium]
MSEIPRRRVLTALALGLTTAAGCGTGTYRGPQRTLRIATGQRGEVNLAFVELLATEIRHEEPRLRVTAIPSEGSLENLQYLRAGQADLALVLADVAQAATTSDGPLAPVPMRAIGRIYENYLHLVVLAASPVHTLADLAGRTVSSGSYGSAARLNGYRILIAAGLAPAAPPAAPSAAVHVQHHRLPDAITALEAGRVDALLWAGGLPTPVLAELSARRGIRLLSLASALPALQSAYGPVYQLDTVPANVYGFAPELPTIGIANLLVCRPDAAPAVTAAVARVLVTRAARLVPEQALGTQFLDPRSLIATAGIPLHPGAITAYRSLHG